MLSTSNLFALRVNDYKSYAYASLFVAGNIVLPQVCHLLPFGGHILLPIYFFTLIAAYKYGFFTGLMTAIASPLINHLLFGMPTAEVLPAILVKSVLLAGAASYLAYRTKQVSILALLLVVVLYQTVGSLAEWALTGSATAAIQDLRMGIPGMLLQVFVGYLCLKALTKKK